MASVGSRIVKQFDLLLIRHDIPPPLPPPTPPQSGALTVSSSSTTPTLSHATNKPRAPVLHYNLSTPPNPIGPSDLLFTSVFIRPLDPSVLIRSASLLVERRIDLHDVDPPVQQQQQPPQQMPNGMPPSAMAQNGQHPQLGVNHPQGPIPRLSHQQMQASMELVKRLRDEHKSKCRLPTDVETRD